jgi:Tfp pilus assembly protein PilX
MKFLPVVTSLTFLLLTSPVTPIRAQAENSCVAQASTGSDAFEKITALSRARNLARQAAEAANGGLENYRADTSMHGWTEQAPCADNGDGTWTFTFQGTTPNSNTPTVESVVTVDSRTWKVTVDRNTPLR